MRLTTLLFLFRMISPEAMPADDNAFPLVLATKKKGASTTLAIVIKKLLSEEAERCIACAVVAYIGRSVCPRMVEPFECWSL
jgi:hypothetical protein